jgi:hypothetical protein
MTCTHCGARAQTYLCATCVKDLRAKLLGMPTLVAYLNDSAVGATRMSGQGSKSGYASTVPAYDPRASACADGNRRHTRPVGAAHRQKPQTGP